MAINAALVIGTSRPDGNTWGVLRAANERLGLPIFNLSDLRISYFDYNYQNLNDDFIPTIEKLIKFDVIGLVSPVYWYTVSAQMKTFLDRFSDLLGPRKDLGRQLRGKQTFLLATGNTEGTLPDCMDQTIRQTAGYLGMKYTGSHYARIVEDLVFTQEIVDQARRFLEAKCGI